MLFSLTPGSGFQPLYRLRISPRMSAFVSLLSISPPGSKVRSEVSDDAITFRPNLYLVLHKTIYNTNHTQTGLVIVMLTFKILSQFQKKASFLPNFSPHNYFLYSELKKRAESTKGFRVEDVEYLILLIQLEKCFLLRFE